MTKIVGILNLTEDSFSDGGQFLEPDKAISHARHLKKVGADFVELGPASSNPDASAVSVEEEINRCRPIIEALNKESIKFGVDSFRSKTQLFAINHGAEFINDIHGFCDESIYEDLAQSSAKLIVMHSMQSTGIADRKTRSTTEVLDNIHSFFSCRLVQLKNSGISSDRIVIDPGMGFFLSSDPDVSIAVLKHLRHLREEFACKLFISVSRKSFLRQIANVEVSDALAATLAAELFCARNCADYIRTHDVAALGAALRVQQKLDLQ